MTHITCIKCGNVPWQCSCGPEEPAVEQTHEENLVIAPTRCPSCGGLFRLKDKRVDPPNGLAGWAGQSVDWWHCDSCNAWTPLWVPRQVSVEPAFSDSKTQRSSVEITKMGEEDRKEINDAVRRERRKLYEETYGEKALTLESRVADLERRVDEIVGLFKSGSAMFRP